MFRRRDYLLQYIEKLGEYLRRRARGERDAALDAELADTLDMRLEELEDLSDEWLRERLLTHEQLDHPRALLASEAALSVGLVRLAEERPLAAAWLFERAALLLDWALGGETGPLAARLVPHVIALATALRSAEVTAEARAAVMRRAEGLGRYDVAEDLLFDLAADGWPEALDWGGPFYVRMARLDPEALRRGGLEPSDAATGLEALRRQWAAEPRDRGLPPPAGEPAGVIETE